MKTLFLALIFFFIALLLSFIGTVMAQPISSDYCEGLNAALVEVAKAHASGMPREVFLKQWQEAVTEAYQTSAPLVQDREDYARAIQLGITVFDSGDTPEVVTQKFMSSCMSHVISTGFRG